MAGVIWKRTDHGDYPEVGDEISMVIYREDSERVVVYRRMRVTVVLPGQRRGTEIYGPAVPSDGMVDLELPGRPEPLFGMAVFWAQAT